MIGPNGLRLFYDKMHVGTYFETQVGLENGPKINKKRVPRGLYVKLVF